MNPSKIIAMALVGVVSALVLVQAGHYGGGASGASGDSHALAHYGGGACSGYGCNNQAPRSGPYHSYAVRPAIYGGRGLYTYQGYARHAPAPSSHGRYARSYGMAPRSRYASGGHHHAAPARHYAAPARHYAPAAPTHHVRPVHAILLVTEHAQPSYNSGSHGGRYARGASGYGSGHGSGYGSGHGSAHGASHYGAANTRAHEQQRYHHGGYRQQQQQHHAGGYGNQGHY